MKSLKVVAILSLGTLVTAATALPTFMPVFQKTYSLTADSKLSKQTCSICHVGKTPKLNPYGLDMKKAMGGSKVITAEVLKKIEKLDSDKDGVKNGAEIKAGTNPGDPKDKPAK